MAPHGGTRQDGHRSSDHPRRVGHHQERGAESIRAYVAYPERKSKAPAIIVIHEIFGLTDWEPTVADRLAKEGYVAILPDLLSPSTGSHRPIPTRAASSSASSSPSVSPPTSTRCMPT